jgi:predicted transport protein
MMAYKKAGNYSLDEHLKDKSERIKGLFKKIEIGVGAMDSVFEINPAKGYVGFMKSGKNIVQLIIQQKQIIVQLLRVRPEDLDDPAQRLKYIHHSMSDYGKHISEMYIESESDVEYVLVLTNQIYLKFKDKIKGW